MPSYLAPISRLLMKKLSMTDRSPELQAFISKKQGPNFLRISSSNISRYIILYGARHAPHSIAFADLILIAARQCTESYTV